VIPRAPSPSVKQKKPKKSKLIKSKPTELLLTKSGNPENYRNLRSSDVNSNYGSIIANLKTVHQRNWSTCSEPEYAEPPPDISANEFHERNNSYNCDESELTASGWERQMSSEGKKVTFCICFNSTTNEFNQAPAHIGLMFIPALIRFLNWLLSKMSENSQNFLLFADSTIRFPCKFRSTKKIRMASVL
jgi:hypothetical protein